MPRRKRNDDPGKPYEIRKWRDEETGGKDGRLWRVLESHKADKVKRNMDRSFRIKPFRLRIFSGKFGRSRAREYVGVFSRYSGAHSARLHILYRNGQSWKWRGAGEIVRFRDCRKGRTVRRTTVWNGQTGRAREYVTHKINCTRVNWNTIFGQELFV